MHSSMSQNTFGVFFFAAKNKLSQKLSFFILGVFMKVFGVSTGVILGTFVARSRFFVKRWDLRSCRSTAFCLDFQGLRPPGGFKKRNKKQLVRMTFF